MNKLSWHQSWYKSLHDFWYGPDTSLPEDMCKYLGAWLRITVFLIFVFGMIGSLIAALIWSFYSVFISPDPETYGADIMVFCIICVTFVVLLISIVVSSDRFKRWKQEFCKPLKW